MTAQAWAQGDHGAAAHGGGSLTELSPFTADLARRFNLEETTVQRVLLAFLVRTPFSRICQETGIPLEVITRIWSMRWEESFGPRKIGSGSRRAHAAADAASVAHDAALAEQVRILLQAEVSNEDIRSYFGITEERLSSLMPLMSRKRARQ